jgi:E3 ubiquitin-protein ligase RGLG
MGQKDSKPSHGYGYSSYDYGSASSGYTSRNTGNSSSSYSVRYAPSSENSVQPETHARLQRKYSKIGDDYRSLSQVCLGGMATTSFTAALICIVTFGL